MSEEIKKLGADIQKEMNDLRDSVKNLSATETSVKEANEKMEKMRKDFGEKLEAQKSMFETHQTEVKKAIEDAKKSKAEGKSVSFADAVRKGLSDNDALKNFEAGKMKAMSMSVKSPITMTFGDSTTGDPSKIMRPGIVEEVSRRNHIRELIPTNSIAAEIFEVPKEKNQEGGAGNTAEGALKSQFSSEIIVDKYGVETIAARVLVSRRMLRNIDALTNYLNSRLPNLVLKQEDEQLLNGTGVSPQLFGVGKDAVAHSDIDYGEEVIQAQNWDVLASVMGFQMSEDFDVNGIVVNPIDFFDMVKAKGTNGQYVSPLMFVNGQALLYGVPVMKSTAVTKGGYFLGDWTQSELLFNEALNIRFSEEDGDNFSKNLVTVRCEEDVIHAIYQEKAYVKADFADGIAALTGS